MFTMYLFDKMIRIFPFILNAKSNSLFCSLPLTNTLSSPGYTWCGLFQLEMFVHLSYKKNPCCHTPWSILLRCISFRASNAASVLFKHFYIYRLLRIKLVIGKFAAAVICSCYHLCLFRSTNNWPTMFCTLRWWGQESLASNYTRLLAVTQKAV